MLIFEHIVFYRLGRFLAVNFPLRFSYSLAVILSDFHYFFAKIDRENVKANLKTIFPEKSVREIVRIRKAIFRNFAKYLVDFFRISKLDKEYIKKNVTIKNFTYFKETFVNQKGAIALSMHIGNWELGGAIMSILGYPVFAVALPHKDHRVDDFFNTQRKEKGINVIPLGRAVKDCLNALKSKKLVALLGDRDFTEKGVILNFFGKPTFFPEGPAVFALRTGTPIIPAFFLRNNNESFSLIFERPIEFISSGDKEDDIKQIIKQYTLIFEGYIKKYPEQWYMFRKFWLNHK